MTTNYFRTDSYSRDDETSFYNAKFDVYPSGAIGLSESMGLDVEKAVALTQNDTRYMAALDGGCISHADIIRISQSPEDPGVPRGTIEKCESNRSKPEEHIGIPIFVCGRNLTWIDDSLNKDPDRVDNAAESDISPHSLQK